MYMVSNRIRELRQKKGLTLKGMSKKLKENGVSLSASSLIKYERGERNPKLETWIELARFFDVPVSYLQGINGDSDWAMEGITQESEVFDRLFRLRLRESEPEYRDEEIPNDNSLDDFSTIYGALVKSNKNFSGDTQILRTLSTSKRNKIVEALSDCYFLTVNALGGDRKAMDSYKKIVKIYSEYLYYKFKNERL